MNPCRVGHATHPQWRQAVDLAVAQLGLPPGASQAVGTDAGANTLGLVYATEAFHSELAGIVSALQARTGVQQWAGTVATGVCATGVEYSGEPALAVMLVELPPDSFRLFVGDQLPGGAGFGQRAGDMQAFTALVHADPAMPALPDAVADMARRIETGYLFGGLGSAEPGPPSQVAGELAQGGMSGVLFSERVRLLSRVTQGCAPLGSEHVVSDCVSHYIRMLDGQPALDVMLADLGVEETTRHSRDGEEILRALPRERLRRGLLVGIAAAGRDRKIGFGDYLVRNLLGIDPHNRLLAIGAEPQRGERVVFCTRDRAAARADLIRVCTELRNELEDEGLVARGAVYFSCVARGEHLFGTQGAELDIIRHNLGDLPLVGMYANGEIARNHVYGHTGVLTLFV